MRFDRRIRPKVRFGEVRRGGGEPGEFAECPQCGADLPRAALACPDCGSDASTGWAGDAAFEIPEFGSEIEGEDEARSALADSARRRKWWVRLGMAALGLYILARMLRGTVY